MITIQASNIAIVSIITTITMLFYISLVKLVGMARQKYKVKAPAVTGHIMFEKYLRIQLNTLEQLPIFLSGFWLCALISNAYLAAAFATIWIIARIAYVPLYLNDKNRSLATYPSYISAFIMHFAAFSKSISLLLIN